MPKFSAIFVQVHEHVKISLTPQKGQNHCDSTAMSRCRPWESNTEPHGTRVGAFSGEPSAGRKPATLIPKQNIYSVLIIEATGRGVTQELPPSDRSPPARRRGQRAPQMGVLKRIENERNARADGCSMGPNALDQENGAV